MNDKNMTALVSCFARAYHYKNHRCRIFNDPFAEKILKKEEYDKIARNMSNGISFFNPDFQGTKEDALRWIVENQLSPSVLGRSIFCETTLQNEMKLGCNQYLIYASGYDTSAYKECFKRLTVFEIDRKEMIEDKRKRLEENHFLFPNLHLISCDFTNRDWMDSILKSKYNPNEKSFSSLLGISYYLTKEDFSNMIQSISNRICKGSGILFDYPTTLESEEMSTTSKLAKEAKEEMKAKYSYEEVEKLLSDHNLLIYEHLDDVQMSKRYFETYNTLHPDNKIVAPKGVAYCFAVKKDATFLEEKYYER